jgi:lipopolysaccharide/colanic/teichoic acid biosynthesis glycosyltransferase
LLAFFPFCIIIALLVKLTSKGPVFYRSHRVGMGGEPFMFVKFRSMYVDADRRFAELSQFNEKDGPIFKMKEDPRVTPVGRFLRKYSLDELPQILHVLSGHMSLVGPRPQLPREVLQYDQECLVRLSVKPGITCYWQVMGRSSLTFKEWMELDRKYVDEMSFWTDLWIIVRTPLAVLRGSGAY